MKCIVTGGAGFIGSHLSERLLNDGHEVLVIDNLSNGKEKNLVDFKDHPKLKFVKADCSDQESITALFKNSDWVFHLAALADIVPSIEDPLKYHKANVDGTAVVAQAAKEAEVKRFVYAASSSCYGLPDVFPTPETADMRPMYPYALTKMLGEQIVMHWQQVYGLPAVSLRFFNVYGPRARTSGTYGAVMGVFLAQKLAGKPLTIVGDGEQTRDFTYVTDIADACVRAAESNLVGEIMNVGSGGHYSVNKLAKLMGGNIEFIPKRPGEPDCTFADTSKIETLLGWKASVPFEEGVRKILERINDWRDAPVWDKDSIADATKKWFEHLGEK